MDISSIIYHHLKNNKQVSATTLCNFLIEEHGFTSKTFSTGRPKLYVDVVSYLEELHRRGTINAISRDQVDCIYEVIETDKLNIKQEEAENKEKLQVKKEEVHEEELQLSLF
ncbi:DUF3895 domain-containing protein [Metabacillus sp. HB246100]